MLKKVDVKVYINYILWLGLMLISTRVFAASEQSYFTVNLFAESNLSSPSQSSNSFFDPRYLNESDYLNLPPCDYTQQLSYPSDYCFVPLNPESDIQLQLKMFSYQFSVRQVIDNQYQISPMINNKLNCGPEYLMRNRQQSFNTAYKIISAFLMEDPSLKLQLESAAGYGVFETTAFNVFLYAGGWGQGMVFDNVEKNVIYADTARVGTGLGIGYITEYTLVVFHSHFAIEQYFGAKVGGDVGASATVGIWSKALSFNPQISTYKLYQTGANIQGNWGATAYWVSPSLN